MLSATNSVLKFVYGLTLDIQKGFWFGLHIFKVYISFQYSFKFSFQQLAMRPREGKKNQRTQKIV